MDGREAPVYVPTKLIFGVEFETLARYVGILKYMVKCVLLSYVFCCFSLSNSMNSALSESIICF